jgi:hypothetical protein
MDRLGRDPLTGHSHWVDWIGKVKGRNSIRELGGTGGRNRKNEKCRVQYTQLICEHEK